MSCVFTLAMFVCIVLLKINSWRSMARYKEFQVGLHQCMTTLRRTDRGGCGFYLQKSLLVDDDEVICSTLSVVLAESGFEVTSAHNVVQALGYITRQQYDVLLSDLHMPGAGDGLTVVSAMRHANPSAVTLLLSAFPRMEAATQAILLQADEILVKRVNIPSLVETIQHRVAIGPARARVIESVAAIIERTA